MQIRFATVEFSGTDGISLSLSPSSPLSLSFSQRSIELSSENNNFWKRIDDIIAFILEISRNFFTFYIITLRNVTRIKMVFPTSSRKELVQFFLIERTIKFSSIKEEGRFSLF